MYQNLVKEFTDRFCESAVEYCIDMMTDMAEEYPSFKEARACLEYSIESFSDVQLEEYLAEFCEEVRKSIKNKVVQVSEATFDEKGFKDCNLIFTDKV